MVLCRHMRSIIRNQSCSHFVARAAGFVIVVAAFNTVPFHESKAQITPLLKVKVDVSPSVGVL